MNCSWLQYRHECALSFHTESSMRFADENVAMGTSGIAAWRAIAVS